MHAVFLNWKFWRKKLPRDPDKETEIQSNNKMWEYYTVHCVQSADQNCFVNIFFYTVYSLMEDVFGGSISL